MDKGNGHYHREVGERIRDARKRAGMSQGDVGLKIGISHVQISKYERGESEVPIARARDIADLLAIDGSELLGTHAKGVTPEALAIAYKIDAIPAANRAVLVEGINKLLDFAARVSGSLS